MMCSCSLPSFRYCSVRHLLELPVSSLRVAIQHNEFGSFELHYQTWANVLRHHFDSLSLFLSLCLKYTTTAGSVNPGLGVGLDFCLSGTLEESEVLSIIRAGQRGSEPYPVSDLRLRDSSGARAPDSPALDSLHDHLPFGAVRGVETIALFDRNNLADHFLAAFRE